MHILFLTDNFPPEVNAPASRTFEHCREWVKAGREVTVITCAPNFPNGVVYEGYRNRLWQSEMMDGIRVVRVWSYITANEGFLRRILDYTSYMAAAVAAAPFVKNVDLVIGTSPHFFTACAAYAVSRTKQVPFIFELRDLWPESIKAVGAIRSSFWLRQLERIELHLYRKAARIVALTNAFKTRLAARGVDPAKIDIVTNGVDLARFRPQEKDAELAARLSLNGKFVAGYIGTHGMAHGLTTLLDAAALMRGRQGGERFKFLFLGDGARKQTLMEEAKQRGLDNVIFLDSVPKSEVTRHWSLLDASIIHLCKSDLFTTVIPSKLFESMGMGIPVLHGVAGESSEIVKRERVGLVFEPENAEALCDALMALANSETLRDEFRANCVAAARRYDRTALARIMLEILDATLARQATTTGEAVRLTNRQN
jgi:glycosyltransferase involved in cell wall biosynthesis